MQCSNSSIPMSKVKTSGDYVVPGFNEYAKELHTEAPSCFLAWKPLEKPRAGLYYTDICQSKLRFKNELKICKLNEDSLRANALAKFYMQKDSYSFWKDIKHADNNAKIPLASKMNDCVGVLNSVNPVELMVLLQNILFMLMNVFMLFYLFYLIVLFPMDIHKNLYCPDY